MQEVKRIINHHHYLIIIAVIIIIVFIVMFVITIMHFQSICSDIIVLNNGFLTEQKCLLSGKVTIQDDAVSISDTQKTLQKLLNQVTRGSEKKGSEVNIKRQSAW